MLRPRLDSPVWKERRPTRSLSRSRRRLTAPRSGRAAKASLAMPLKAMPVLPAWPSAIARASVCVVDLEQAEKRFARLTRALRAREPGEDRRALTVEWMHANHGFHDVIYRVADLPYIEQVAKSARRTFSGPAVWAPGDETIDELYLQNERQHEAIKDALSVGSKEGARVLAREHVLASFNLLETILEQVGVPK